MEANILGSIGIWSEQGEACLTSMLLGVLSACSPVISLKRLNDKGF